MYFDAEQAPFPDIAPSADRHAGAFTLLTEIGSNLPRNLTRLRGKT